jgi:acid phosphatase
MNVGSPAQGWFVLPFLLAIAAASFAGPDTPRQIENLDSAKQSIISYHDSGRWDRDTLKVIHKAEHWIADRSGHGDKLALVLDIDETALLNWPEERKTDFGYVPDLWNAWEKQGKAPASPEVLELFRFARKRHVVVFFITGRHEASRLGTVKNLADVGYVGYRELVMKPDTNHERSAIPFKSSARAAIERQGYRIIENVGDQWSDLKGGHSERVFKVPNPMYLIP